MKKGLYFAVSVVVMLALTVGGCVLQRQVPDSLISGITQDFQGNPIGGVTIQGPNGTEVTSDTDGSFSLEVVPGNIVLNAQKGIYNGQVAFKVATGQSYTDVVLSLKDYWSLLEFDGADEGSIVENWKKQNLHLADSANSVSGIDVNSVTSIATFWYEDRQDARDIVTYGLSHLEWPRDTYNQIQFRVRVKENARVGIELFWQIAGEGQSAEVESVKSYYTGTGDWETIAFNIGSSREYLRMIQVGVGERNPNDGGQIDFGGGRLEVDFDWVRLYQVD